MSTAVFSPGFLQLELASWDTFCVNLALTGNPILQSALVLPTEGTTIPPASYRHEQLLGYLPMLISTNPGS